MLIATAFDDDDHRVIEDGIDLDKQGNEMVIEYPVLVISDLHIGHPASLVRHAEQLTPLFRSAATIVFNGDTAESLWLHHRPRAQKHLQDVIDLCGAEGVKPILINGNHDPCISQQNHLELLQGEILVTHGEVLFDDLTPWSRDAKVVGAAYRKILQQYDAGMLADFEQRLKAVKRASLVLEEKLLSVKEGRFAELRMILRESWPPWRPLRILKTWADTPVRAFSLAREFRPQARFVIIGHTHRAGVWQISSRTIINTGSYLPLSGRSGVLIDHDTKTLQVRQIVHSRRKFALGGVLKTFPMQTPQDNGKQNYTWRDEPILSAV